MALQLRQINARPYARGQEELENRLKKLRKQKDIVAAVIEDMMQRAELVASRVTSVRNLNEFLRQFEAATGSIDEMYMKMFQVHFLLTADDFFGGNAHYLRAPMAITYSVPASTTRNDAQGAPLQAIEGFGSLSSTSRPPSVASPDLSGCDDGLGTYCSASAGRGRELPPPRAPAYTSPGAPSAVGAPHGPTYPVSGAQALLAAPRATLAYGSPGPRQQFAMPPACSGRGAVPKCLSPTPLGYVSPADQFSDNLPSPSMPETRCVSGRGTWPQLPSSPSPVDRSSSVQLRGYGRGVLPKPSPPPTPGYANLRAQPSGSWPEVQSPPTPVCESPEVQSPHTPVCENPETQFMAGSGTVPEVQSPPTLVYGSPGGAEFMAGSGALPKLPSPPTLGYESREAQFMSSRAKLASPPTSSYMSLGAQLTPKPKLTAAQTSSVPSSCTAPSELNLPPATVHTGLMAPPTDRADVGHVEKTLGHSVTPRAKAPVRGAMPVAKGVAPPPVHSATTTPHKSAKGAVKEDVRDRGDVCSVLDEADQGNNSYSQGQGKPAGSKANVPVPPGFTALDRQPEHVVTSVKTRSAGSSSPQKTLNTTMAGSIRSPSPRIGSLMPNSRNYFSIAPADTSVVGSTREVVLSFYKTPSEFSLQLKSSGEVLDSLLNNLTAYYRSNVPPQEFEAMVGMHCVAHYAEDDHWYRARILALEPDHARVLYVDFGNCEHVSLDKLRFLVEQFSSPPAQAYNCSIRVRSIPGGKKTWPLPAVRRFWDMLSVPETKLEAVFYSKSTMSDSFVVDILGKTGDRPEANLSQQFLCMSKAEGQKSSQASSCAMEIPVAEQPVKVDAPASGPSGCKPRPATGPRAIVRPGSTAEQGAPAASHATASGGAALTVRDGEIGPEPPALADVAPQMVGVPIPPATAILATGPPPTSTPPAFKAAVVAARVGRPQGAPKAVPEVAKPAAAQHPARPPAGIPPAGLLSEGAVARMSHKLSPPDAIHAVLPPDAVPAVPPPLPPLPTVVIPPGIPPAVLPSGKTFTFILSVVFNPSDFYGQILAENGVPEVMKELKQQLNQQGSTSSAPLPELVTKGTFWLCFFEGDKNWYRVQVLDVGNSNSAWRARVLYVDYGNRSVVKLENLRPLPENLARPPARAHRMALAMVSPTQGSKWVNDATQTFVSETGFKTVLVGEKRGRRQAGLETVTDVVVWNKNGETPVNINILLVEKKLAQLKSP